MIVKLREGIRGLEGMFEDGEGWGVDRVKGWIERYERRGLSGIERDRGVMRREYRMECVKEWVEKWRGIREKREF